MNRSRFASRFRFAHSNLSLGPVIVVVTRPKSMLDWLKRGFTQTGDPFAELPHYCRVWLAIETAAHATPLLIQHRPDVPRRQLVYLAAAQRELRKAITTPSPNLHRLRRVERNAIMFAGNAIRLGYPQVSTVPKLTGWAGAALIKGPEESQNCLDECASLAYDSTVDLVAPEIWSAIMDRANCIHDLAARNNWSDTDVVPANMMLEQDG